jgi:PAS domain S-box-containing protein
MRTGKELRELLNAIQVGIILIDSETKKIVNCNPAALKIFKATEDQVIGKASQSFMCPTQVRQYDLINGQKMIERMERELMTIDGTKIPIFKTVSRIMLSGKELILESFVDISEQKKAELERQMLEMEMNQARKLEAVGSLASGIAHEINTPIQFVGDNTNFIANSFKSIISLIESYDSLWQEANAGAELASLDSRRIKAKEDADLEYLKEEIPSAVEQTLEGVQRVTKIVRAMKDFAHSDQGEKSSSNINDMLESTLTVARNELKYVADVETDFDRELPGIECYRDDLNQVFLNLLVNAAHAVGDVVGDASAGKGTITVSTERDNDNVIIKISDTGTGIPEAIRDRIFDPFFSTKDVGKGSGQGLAIARKIIVEKHEGSLDFETEEGKGTTFIICLPITIPEVVGVS